jgi:geranylgeranyl pyrophosphate synthase
MQATYSVAEDGDSSQWNELIGQIVRELRTSPAVDAARREAESFLEMARANLAGLPDSPYRQALYELCDFVVQRTY